LGSELGFSFARAVNALVKMGWRFFWMYSVAAAASGTGSRTTVKCAEGMGQGSFEKYSKRVKYLSKGPTKWRAKTEMGL
jgi:hypothetical protein